MRDSPQVLEVWGDFACYSRPELKVERFSYPIPTPSSARGVFDAIYVKPAEFRWQVTKVEVLEKPSYIALRRNEVKDVVNVNAVTRWLAGKENPEPLWADGDRELLGSDEKGRTQRQTMALRNVRYRLWAEIRPWPGFAGRGDAFVAQFRRRAEKGKCFFQPYLGCREFPAFFRLVDPERETRRPIEDDIDVGWMLYDVFDLSRPGSGHDAPAISLFQAHVREGVLEVPPYHSAEVFKHEAAGGG